MLQFLMSFKRLKTFFFPLSRTSPSGDHRGILCTLSSIVLLSTLTACHDDHVDDVTGTTDTPIHLYLLSEGLWGGNNSAISAIDDRGNLMTDLYLNANGRWLGDTGNDLLWHKNHLYVAVAGSRYVAQLSPDGKELHRHTFDDTLGDPRYLAVQNDHLYVSLYGGMVARFDISDSLALIDTCPVGSYPEEMAIVDNYLVVCNSGWGNDNTLSIIDLNSFTELKKVQTDYNPTRIVSTDDHRVFFLTTTYDIDWTPISKITRLDCSNWELKDIASANKMLATPDKLLMIQSDINYYTTPYSYTNTFISYDLNTEKLTEGGFFLNRDIEQQLATRGIYMLARDPGNGDFYIATTEQDNNGSPVSSRLYVISDEGHLISLHEDTGGINTSTATFRSE